MDGTGKGLAAAQIIRVQSGGVQSVQSVANPIDTASDELYLVLYGTGIRHRSSDQAARCTINGVDAPVLYSGPQGSSARRCSAAVRAAEHHDRVLRYIAAHPQGGRHCLDVRRTPVHTPESAASRCKPEEDS